MIKQAIPVWIRLRFWSVNSEQFTVISVSVYSEELKMKNEKYEL